MNSDLMPSPESADNEASTEALPKIEAIRPILLPRASKPEKPEKPEKPDVKESENALESQFVNRLQPIPPPSEPMQYRAIGLVRGRYRAASPEQFTQGLLQTPDGAEIDAVLLGRIMSLVKNHLDLEAEHLWVVYPRTRQESDKLHLQIVGVWEPEKLAKNLSSQLPGSNRDENVSSKNISSESVSSETAINYVPSTEIPDGGFSVRGEVVYHSCDQNIVIKIKQAPRKSDDLPKYFKLKLKGDLGPRATGKFWDLQVKREADVLVVEKSQSIADLPKKRRPPISHGGGRGGFRGRRPYPPRKQLTVGGDTPRPVKRNADASVLSAQRPVQQRTNSEAVPKPIKKQKTQ